MAMTGTSSPATGGLVLRLAATAGGRIASLWNAYRGRRAVARLLDFDERTLRDMGVTRGDVHAAMASGVADDPSRHLATLAKERRSAWTSQKREQRSAAKLEIW